MSTVVVTAMLTVVSLVVVLSFVLGVYEEVSVDPVIKDVVLIAAVDSGIVLVFITVVVSGIVKTVVVISSDVCVVMSCIVVASVLTGAVA